MPANPPEDGNPLAIPFAHLRSLLVFRTMVPQKARVFLIFFLPFFRPHLRDLVHRKSTCLINCASLCTLCLSYRRRIYFPRPCISSQFSRAQRRATQSMSDSQNCYLPLRFVLFPAIFPAYPRKASLAARFWSYIIASDDDDATTISDAESFPSNFVIV